MVWYAWSLKPSVNEDLLQTSKYSSVKAQEGAFDKEMTLSRHLLQLLWKIDILWCQNCCTLFLGLALGLADDLLEDLAPDLEPQVDQKHNQLVSELAVLVRILPLTLLEVGHSILKNRCVRAFTIMEYSSIIYLIPWCPLNQDDSPVVELLVEPGTDETNIFLEWIQIQIQLFR